MRPGLKTALEYILTAIIVIVLGGLAGWYFFLRNATSDTVSKDTARGYTSNSFDVGGGAQSPANATSTIAETTGAAQKPPQLWHVATAPIGGASFVGTSTNMRLRFAERSSGNIFDVDPASGSVTRVSNKLMPKIYEAAFAHGGGVILRSLDENGIETTFLGTLRTTSSSTETLSGSYVAGGIKHFSLDSISGSLTYLTAAGEGYGIFRLGQDGKPKLLMSSILADWRLEAAGPKTIVLQSPADGLTGIAFELTSGGALRTLTSNVPGLTVLAHPTASMLLFSSSNGGPTLFARMSASSTSLRLPVKTIAEKCIWLPGTTFTAYCGVPQTVPTGNFLDAWYQGAVHTADQIWKIDASAGTAEVAYTPGTNLSLDVKDPVVDDSGQFIAFKDAHDDSLWILRITP